MDHTDKVEDYANCPQDSYEEVLIFIRTTLSFYGTIFIIQPYHFVHNFKECFFATVDHDV